MLTNLVAFITFRLWTLSETDYSERGEFSRYGRRLGGGAALSLIYREPPSTPDNYTFMILGNIVIETFFKGGPVMVPILITSLFSLTVAIDPINQVTTRDKIFASTT